MKILLNGKEVNPEILTVNDGLNYGRFFDAETQVFELQLSKSELKNLIEKEYIQARDEIKEDDKKYKEISDFTNTNYCSLSKLLNHEFDFGEVMKTYLDIVLFQKVFKNNSANIYVINSKDEIKVYENRISFNGRVFTKVKL